MSVDPSPSPGDDEWHRLERLRIASARTTSGDVVLDHSDIQADLSAMEFMSPSLSLASLNFDRESSQALGLNSQTSGREQSTMPGEDRLRRANSKESVRSTSGKDWLSNGRQATPEQRRYGSRGSSGGGSNLINTERKWRLKTPTLSQFTRNCVESSRWAVEWKGTVLFTTIVTVWVLMAEDLKQIHFDKSWDYFFGWLGIVCITVFTLEIFLSCIGKVDYFLGFFFILDVCGTVSLVFDLPWFLEAVSGDEDEMDGQDAMSESSQGLRVGARSARVARVIRLIRIAKLYKAVHEAKAKSRDRVVKAKAKEAEDLDEDFTNNESRVGKKLSDLTIRRVIILVLSMLIIMPLLSPEESYKLPASPSYGADEVWISFQDMEASDSEQSRFRYETTMLRYMFFHNWFAGHNGCPKGRQSKLCPAMYDSHLYFIGMSGRNGTLVAAMAERARIRNTTVAAWVSNVSDQDDIYLYGQMPEEVLSRFLTPWINCTSNGSQTVRIGFSLIAEQVPSIRCPYELRSVERQPFFPRHITVDQFNELRVEFFFDQRPYVKLEAAYSMGTTLFICLVLCTAAIMFYNDVNQLVLYPVENMISKVEAIRDNPLMAIQMAEQDFAKELHRQESSDRGGLAGLLGYSKRTSSGERLGSSRPGNMHAGGGFSYHAQKSQTWDSSDLPNYPTGWRKDCIAFCEKVMRVALCSGNPDKEEPMETVILEKTIIKLGSLLALGFGEAGAHIINQNMIGSSSSGVNAMVPGQRIDCVIGHARIQNFSVCTEVLQSKVMTFVNQVAEIVHGVVNELHGAANKNNGDTFLLIWRCKKWDADSEDEDSEEDRPKDKPKAAVAVQSESLRPRRRLTDGIWKDEHFAPTKLADMAVLAFAKIIGAVHSSPVLADYRGHPGLQHKLGSNYRVEIKCGLHFGWAIEGAVGSEYKIDASYLSPNVAVTIGMEEATKYYSVCFLATQAVVSLCSLGMASKCRLIDRVLVPGSKDALELYSIDLDTSSVRLENKGRVNIMWSSRARMRARQRLEADKSANKFEDMPELFEQDPNIMAMRRSCTEQFQENFRMGYQNYAQGEWQVARRFLEQTHQLHNDGPSWFLIRFMESWQFEAPPDWQGIHVLGPASNLSWAGTSYAPTSGERQGYHAL